MHDVETYSPQGPQEHRVDLLEPISITYLGLAFDLA